MCSLPIWQTGSASAIAYHEPFEYLPELRGCRTSQRIDAVEPAMLARLHDYASSLATLPDTFSLG